MVFFYVPEWMIHVLLLDVTTKVTQKMAELWKEYPSLMIMAQSEWEEGKNGLILQSCTVYACFVGKWNPDHEMTSQSKLDTISCNVDLEPKKHPTSLLWN